MAHQGTSIVVCGMYIAVICTGFFTWGGGGADDDVESIMSKISMSSKDEL